MNTTRIYNSDRLNTNSLHVGQQLVRTAVSTYGYRDATRKVTSDILTITKILKTRLVVEDENGRETRYIVEYSKTWPSRNGDVSTDTEGSRSAGYYHSSGNYITLWTTDDPALVEYLATIDEHNRKANAKDTARASVNPVTADPRRMCGDCQKGAGW